MASALYYAEHLHLRPFMAHARAFLIEQERQQQLTPVWAGDKRHYLCAECRAVLTTPELRALHYDEYLAATRTLNVER